MSIFKDMFNKKAFDGDAVMRTGRKLAAGLLIAASAVGTMGYTPQAAAAGNNVLGDILGHIEQTVGAQGKVIGGMAIGKAAGGIAGVLGVGDNYSDCISSTTTEVYSRGGTNGQSANNTADQITRCAAQKQQAQQQVQASQVYQDQQRSAQARQMCDSMFYRAMQGDPQAMTAVQNCQSMGWKPPKM